MALSRGRARPAHPQDRRLVVRETLHTKIATNALIMAIERQRPPPGLIHHSDRGVQHAAEAYRQRLVKSLLPRPLAAVATAWTMPPMESFFHTLKVERVHHRVYPTRAHARRDLFGYIEGFYNSRRLHSALGYLSPSDAERKAA